MTEAQFAPEPIKKRFRWWMIFQAIYVVLLATSYIQRATLKTDVVALLPQQHSRMVAEVRDGRPTGRQIRIAYFDIPGTDVEKNSFPIVLTHGSPGSGDDLAKLTAKLKGKRRMIVPDLPGFGNSTHEIADYSIRAHAIYLEELLDQLEIEKVHLVAHSMGGGVVLNLAQVEPQRVASITMVSAIGVQEQELLGEYYVNHIVHGAQLAGLRTLRVLVPRFGEWNLSDMGIPYARNFYDSDQRPLRGILNTYSGPMLILHGARDPLVPVEAAYEHARLVPQGKLYVYEGDHFTVFTNPGLVAEQILPFLDEVERGTAKVRGTADTSRLKEATMPMAHTHTAKLLPITAIVLFLALALSTLISEDLACIAAGLLVSDGRAGFLLVTLACLIGIFAGDMMLFLIGKIVGRKTLQWKPVQWLVSPQRLENSQKWLERNGAAVIFTSRFIPGTRLPTYLAAGLLHRRSLRFILYFLVSAAVWTPLLVGSAAGLFLPLMHYGPMATKPLLIKIVLTAVLMLILLRVGMKVATFRGRRQLVGWLYRKVRWEFWPMYVFYPPVFLYVLYLSVKYRGLTAFTSCNPGIVAGGFVGESKCDILKRLSGAREAMLRFALIPKGDAAERVETAKAFLERAGLQFPVVLKPDAGQRGSGVAVIRSDEVLSNYLTNTNYDTIIQEYAEGKEFGVFYYRNPKEPTGHIFSITEKRLPVLVGDGVQTLEHLILSDDRAVCMANFYARKNAGRLEKILANGESVQLVELGTHCRGAIFLDGSAAITPALTVTIDRISKTFEGFYFGRYDIRAPSVEDLMAGRNLKIVELNGVSSEATHIYDPKLSLFKAYRVLFEQWRIAFEIGCENRARGCKPATVSELLQFLVQYQETSREHGE
ncbi:MAG TPA: alpha/beta fold hydrolase [Candidatus Acidoferrum sp.]|jgi:pimeloyl-ACP methyl ester carboxylesterase/membrane protein DedA with SNARE-associated domain